MTRFLLLVACGVPILALTQTNQEQAKAAQQEKRPEDRKPDTASKSGVEILSDTMGVEFGPYVKGLKPIIRDRWNALIPDRALPPLLKSGTVVI